MSNYDDATAQSGGILTDAVHYGAEDERRSKNLYSGFDAQFNQEGIQVPPGHALGLNDRDKMLTTQVGSGIVLTLFDLRSRYGALAHSVLSPELVQAFPNFKHLHPSVVARAVAPINEAVNQMLRHGAEKKDMRIRVFGGAHFPDDPFDTGTKAYVFVKSYLLDNDLSIMSEDIGGRNIMRVHFLPETGAVSRFILRRQADVIDLQIEEEKFLKS